MKENKDRVLAYQLATEVSQEELNEVSGGAAQTVRQSVRITGGSGMGGDVVYDVNFDW